ncbi:MAG: ATP synthase F1 subunit delta [Deltaproteobacteria bacterium]|nr:ATP synthase F1 subunit delta [Deltaproteobacteria bacterium]
MKNVKVARRYAKALLIIGREEGATEVFRREIDSFIAVLDANPGLEAAITNPVYDAAGRRKVLFEVASLLGVATALSAFLTLLFDKGRIGLIRAIAEVFQVLADEDNNVARASLQTAGDLSDETVDAIRAGLSRLTGKSVLLTMEKDPDLIGGIVARIGDLVLDGSVRTQLSNMRASLSEI